MFAGSWSVARRRIRVTETHGVHAGKSISRMTVGMPPPTSPELLDETHCASCLTR